MDSGFAAARGPRNDGGRRIRPQAAECAAPPIVPNAEPTAKEVQPCTPPSEPSSRPPSGASPGPTSRRNPPSRSRSPLRPSWRSSRSASTPARPACCRPRRPRLGAQHRRLRRPADRRRDRGGGRRTLWRRGVSRGGVGWLPRPGRHDPGVTGRPPDAGAGERRVGWAKSHSHLCPRGQPRGSDFAHAGIGGAVAHPATAASRREQLRNPLQISDEAVVLPLA